LTSLKIVEINEIIKKIKPVILLLEEELEEERGSDECPVKGRARGYTRGRHKNEQKNTFMDMFALKFLVMLLLKRCIG
jgi:hypothetical protein